MNILSFDVGGTSIKYGIVNEQSEVLLKGTVPTPQNEITFLETINEIVGDNKNNYLSLWRKFEICNRF